MSFLPAGLYHLYWFDRGADKCAELADSSRSIIIYLPLYQAVCFSPARVYPSAEQQLGPVTGFFIDRRLAIDFP